MKAASFGKYLIPQFSSVYFLLTWTPIMNLSEADLVVLKNGKTVWKSPMMKSYYSKITSFSHVHQVYFPINVTKPLRILSQKTSWWPLTFPKWKCLILGYLAPRQGKRRDCRTSLVICWELQYRISKTYSNFRVA